MTLQEYLVKNGYTVVDPAYRELTKKWGSWYQGKVQGFHDYSIWNGDKDVSQTRAQLNMAKQGAERWADLLWNNECFITLDDGLETKNENGERVAGEAEKKLIAELERNSFTEQTNVLVEKAFATGTGGYVIYPSESGAKIDYVSDEYIYPLSWYNRECLSCAFAGVKMERDGNRTLTLMIHEYQSDGSWIIKNLYFRLAKDSENITPIPLPKGIKETYRAKTKRFELIRPGIVNNAYDVPMGMSIYGNYIDVLKCIDLAFDGVQVSMKLGRPRIAISAAAMRPSPNGPTPVFDSNDIAFYQLPESTDSAAKALIEDITTSYRAGDFETSLQRSLTLYSICIGLGEKAFRWENGSVATATQVISENNGMQRAMEKHQEVLRKAIIVLVRAILDINELDTSVKVSVNFDDSAVRDRNAERMRFWQYVMAGKYPFRKFLVEFEGYNAAEAKTIEAEAKQKTISSQE